VELPVADHDFAWICEQLTRLGCAEIVLVGVTESEGAVFVRGMHTLRCAVSRTYSTLFNLSDQAGDDLVWRSLDRSSELTFLPPSARATEPKQEP
jgi:hypothetical protein